MNYNLGNYYIKYMVSCGNQKQEAEKLSNVKIVTDFLYYNYFEVVF